MAKKEISQSAIDSLKIIVAEFDKDDQAVRERQVRLWKKLNLYWCGFTNIWWSDTNHDWKVYDNQNAEDDGDQSYYDKPINVFRAFLETIISAMSATIPGIKCLPDDADNVNDVLTAKGGTKIAELIYKHNDAPLLWCKALFIYCTQGMIAAYNYPFSDKKYGLVEVDQYKDEEQLHTTKTCPLCQNEIVDEPTVTDEYMPEEENLMDSVPEGVCPNCKMAMEPEVRTDKSFVTKLVGKTSQAKTRQCIEVNGGLFVKVPNYARCQDDIPYLRYSYETHYSNVIKKFPELREKLINSNGAPTAGRGTGYDLYERWARLSPQYYGEYPVNTPTVNNWWLRPSAFEILSDDDARDELLRLFPNGCKTVFINDEFADACNEDLDDCWTLTYNPLSEYIHFDPLGLLLTSIQEITNDLISLTLQTIEHGIPQTFADPNVLNFDTYRQSQTTPGQIFPAKPKSGKTLSESFYEIKTATLSQEVGPFGEKINELGQFVSGALPSLSGGAADNSSKTAAQYAMSRQQALQRLQTPWKMINYWWKGVFSKVIPAYIKTMLDDERIVKEQNGSFINVVIKKSEMDGKLGDVEVEASETVPISPEQIKDIVMQLFTLNNEGINGMLGAPENIPWIAESIGLNNFHIPGENDREKQFEEIQILLQSSPIPGAPNMQTGQPMEMPSLMPEKDIDNHAVHIEICKNYAVSEAGRQAKVNNDAGYKNILLHLQIHAMMMQEQQMNQMMMEMGSPQNSNPQGANSNG